MAITYPISLPTDSIAQPTKTTFRIRRIVGQSTSPFTGQTQTFRHTGEWWEAEIKDRYAISELSGPAILNEETSTTFVPPGWIASSFDDGSLLIREL